MQWQTVESSKIAEVGFEEPETLGVRFKAKGKYPASEYRYSNVPKALHDKIVTATSVGQFFEQNIKKNPDKYPYEKVGTVTVEAPSPGSALAKIDTITVTEMFTAGFMDPILVAVRTEVLAQAAKLDISTEENRKAIASIAYKVAKSKTFVDAQRKAYVGEQKKKLAAIDAVGSHIWTVLEGIQQEVRQPLTEWEDKEKARVKALEDSLAELRQVGPLTMTQYDALTVAEMEDRLHDVENDSTDWQEFTELAKGAKVQAVETITAAIARKRKAEEDSKELERLRAESAARAQQDAIDEAVRAAQEKAEQAQKQLEAEQQASARRAEEAAAEAVRAAERAVEAERQRVEAAEKAAAEEAEARAANTQHRVNVQEDIIMAMVEHTEATRDIAVTVIEAVTKGLIPHVTITY